MGLIMETTEDKINELEDRPIEFTHYEQKRADWKQMNRKQMNRASGTCETKTKDPMFISPGSQKENKERGWKSIQKDNGWEFPRRGERHKSTDSRSRASLQ